MVTIKDFTYTKENGDVSDRVVVLLSQPSNNMLGIDITHLDEEESDNFIEEFKELKLAQRAQEAELLDKHDLKHNYRSFKLSGVSNITHTEL